jgi:hypothetical protein
VRLSRRKLGLGIGAVGLLAGALAATALPAANADPIVDPRCPQTHGDVIISMGPRGEFFDIWEQLNTVVGVVPPPNGQCIYAGVHAIKNPGEATVRIPGTLALPMP